MVFIQDAEPLSLEPNDFSSGARTGVSENFSAALDDQYTNNAQYSLENEFMDAYQNELDKISRLTGEKFNAPALDAFFDIAGEIENNPQRRPNFIREKSLNSFFEQNERIKKLKADYPEIKTAEDIWQSVKNNAVQVEQKAADVSSRATIMGSIGGFGGAMVGSMTVRDPVNLGTLGAGGFGRTILTRVLSEAGINSGVETINEFFGVRENRELLGLENSFGRSLTNIAAAGVGAGVIRGGIETAPIAVNKLSNTQIAQEAKKFLGEKMNSTEKMAIHLIERDELMNAANPYVGDAIDAEATHLENIKRAEKYFEELDPQLVKDIDVDIKGLETKFDPIIERHVKEVTGYVQKAKEIKTELERIDTIDLNKPKTLKPYLGYEPESLTDFIRKNGGIKDVDGELANKGVTNSTAKKPFARSLIREEDEVIATPQGKQTIDNQLNAVKRRAHQAGYFPEKANYDDISDDEFYDAIANDLLDEPIFKDKDREAIAKAVGDKKLVSQYDQMGITGDMSVTEIASKLRDEDIVKDFDYLDDALLEDIRNEYQMEMAARAADQSEYLSEIDMDRVNAELQDIRENSGLFKTSDNFNPDEEITVGYEIDAQGMTVPIRQRIEDILNEIEEDDMLAEAAKGCVI